MKTGSTKQVTRLDGLQQQIGLLTHLAPNKETLVSCYLDIGQTRRQLDHFVHNILGSQLEQAFAAQRLKRASVQKIVEDLLASEMPPRTRGLAFFIAVEDAARLVTAIPLAVPLRNSVTISQAPDLLPLIQLRELYGRFRIALVRPQGIQIAEVNLGDIAVKAWVANPQMHGMQGGVSPSHQRHQIELVEHYLCRGGPCPMFLAGDPGMLQTASSLFTSQVTANLLGALPMPAHRTIHETAAACLRALLDFEYNQAQDLVARTVQTIRHHGPAVSGPVASIDALRSGAVETLLIGSDFRPDGGWACATGENDHDGQPVPLFGTRHRAEDAEELQRRVELIRLAGQHHVPVQFAARGALEYLDGVACLLRKHPQQRTQTYPSRYGSLDMVA